MIRVTMVEKFRMVCEEEWASEEELVASIKGERGAQDWSKADVGTGIHKLIECGVSGPGPHKVGNYLLDDDTLARISQSVVMPPEAECCREIRVVVPIVNPYGDAVYLSGTLDLLWGNQVFDYKCRFGSWSVEDYEASLQWRLYLAMTGARSFSYNVLSFMDLGAPGSLLRFKGSDIVRFWSYPNIKTDCLEWVNRFLEWAGTRGLLPYLENKEP